MKVGKNWKSETTNCLMSSWRDIVKNEKYSKKACLHRFKFPPKYSSLPLKMLSPIQNCKIEVIIGLVKGHLDILCFPYSFSAPTRNRETWWCRVGLMNWLHSWKAFMAAMDDLITGYDFALINSDWIKAKTTSGVAGRQQVECVMQNFSNLVQTTL